MYTMMLVGLHGCGKTTTAAKLAKMLQKKERKPLLVAADVYRPAAVQQLKILGEKIEIPVFSLDTVPPPDLCRRAQDFARENGRDSIIIDTAGRLTIDSELMSELEQIKFQTKPDDIILVVDAMIGQDSVRMASEFNRRLSVSGFILTKMDGDARGGSALSIREVTGKPIKFITTGETLEKLEEFRAEGLASRILGLGDIVGLVKEFEEVVDEKKAEEEALRMLKGDFTLINFLEQIKAIKKMGPLRDVLEKMPFFSEAIPEGAAVDEKVFVRIEAMINSMTHMERLKPEIIDENRAKRIAKGSGTSVSDIFDLMKRFNVMKDVMKRLGKMPGLLAKIPGFRELFQLHKMKGMDLGDMMPDEGGDLEERRKKKTMRLIDLEKRRRKEKMARLARKKARRRR
jgi:signal recognition particle subunit SRP54